MIIILLSMISSIAYTQEFKKAYFAGMLLVHGDLCDHINGVIPLFQDIQVVI